jgi:hypothetical protein
VPATVTDIQERTANRLWARLTAASMIAAPALLLAGNALHPVNHKKDEGEFLAGVAAHETEWYVAHLLIFIGLPLFVPAVVGLVRQVGDRALLLGTAGATLTIGGVFGAEAYVTVEGFVQWTMTNTAGADPEQMAAVLERFNTAAATFIPTGLGTIAFAVGLAMLAVAILRAGVLPMGYPLVVLASRVLAIGVLIAGDVSGEYQQALISAADALLLVGLGGVGVLLLREVDGEIAADGGRVVTP